MNAPQCGIVLLQDWSGQIIRIRDLQDWSGLIIRIRDLQEWSGQIIRIREAWLNTIYCTWLQFIVLWYDDNEWSRFNFRNWIILILDSFVPVKNLSTINTIAMTDLKRYHDYPWVLYDYDCDFNRAIISDRRNIA